MMEKDQPDSLATVAVGSEKIPQSHSHYAPSEVYSSTEPPPAYMRPLMKSTAIQIARIAAMTLITMSVILGSFILAASWIQAKTSHTPESIAAMQAEMKLQQHQQETRFHRQQHEFLSHAQADPLIGAPIESKDSFRRLAEGPVKKEVEAETKEIKVQKEEEDSKVDSESGHREEDDDDYEDDGFPPVRIPLPLELNFEDGLMGMRNKILYVIERRRNDEANDGTNDNTLDNNKSNENMKKDDSSNNNNHNNTDSPASNGQAFGGEHVAIVYESGNSNPPQQQEQEMFTFVPLRALQIQAQQEPSTGYHQYQINTQYQVPDMRQLPLSDQQGLNHIAQDIISAEFGHLPQLNMELRPPRMRPQAPSMAAQDPQTSIPMMYQHHEQTSGMYGQEQQQHQQQQGVAMMPPPPPPAEAIHMMITTEQKPPAPSQTVTERPRQLSEEPQRKFEPLSHLPLNIQSFIQHIVQGRLFPFDELQREVLGSVESVEAPVGARVEVTEEQTSEQQQPQQEPEERNKESSLTHLIMQQKQQPQQEFENRPHYVQPRSVRSDYGNKR